MNPTTSTEHRSSALNPTIVSITSNDHTTLITLSRQQQVILDAAVYENYSFYFTGQAGTGKSLLIKEIIQRLRANRFNVAVTAPTGYAAQSIGGTTLHKWAGDTGSTILQTPETAKRWRETDVLIIDEISMIPASYFELLSKFGQAVRPNSHLPFGGLRLIVSGDFLQLPPITAERHLVYCFQSDAWKKAITKFYSLDTVFRQEAASELSKHLSKLRLGQLEPAEITEMESYFQRLQRPIPDANAAIHIVTTRAQAEEINQERLQNLEGICYNFHAHDALKHTRGAPRLTPEEEKEFLHLEMSIDDHFTAKKLLTIKLGTQVMATKNTHYANNGTIGVVMAFQTESQFNELSLLHSWEEFGSILSSSTPSSARFPPKEILFGSRRGGAKNRLYPVVKFNSSDRLVLIRPLTWEFQLNGRVAKRQQLPLSICYALTIHKVQGQTIPYAIVDLDRIFTSGQIYVALSRVPKEENLQVKGFKYSKVRVDKRVIEFYKSLI